MAMAALDLKHAGRKPSSVETSPAESSEMRVSRNYMALYVAEFQFRYNNRMNADIFGTAIEGC
jgi:hypothetical protein